MTVELIEQQPLGDETQAKHTSLKAKFHTLYQNIERFSPEETFLKDKQLCLLRDNYKRLHEAVECSKSKITQNQEHDNEIVYAISCLEEGIRALESYQKEIPSIKAEYEKGQALIASQSVEALRPNQTQVTNDLVAYLKELDGILTDFYDLPKEDRRFLKPYLKEFTNALLIEIHSAAFITKTRFPSLTELRDNLMKTMNKQNPVNLSLQKAVIEERTRANCSKLAVELAQIKPLQQMVRLSLNIRSGNIFTNNSQAEAKKSPSKFFKKPHGIKSQNPIEILQHQIILLRNLAFRFRAFPKEVIQNYLKALRDRNALKESLEAKKLSHSTNAALLIEQLHHLMTLFPTETFDSYNETILALKKALPEFNYTLQPIPQEVLTPDKVSSELGILTQAIKHQITAMQNFLQSESAQAPEKLQKQIEQHISDLKGRFNSEKESIRTAFRTNLEQAKEAEALILPAQYEEKDAPELKITDYETDYEIFVKQDPTLQQNKEQHLPTTPLDHIKSKFHPETKKEHSTPAPSHYLASAKEKSDKLSAFTDGIINQLKEVATKRLALFEKRTRFICSPNNPYSRTFKMRIEELKPAVAKAKSTIDEVSQHASITLWWQSCNESLNTCAKINLQSLNDFNLAQKAEEHMNDEVFKTTQTVVQVLEAQIKKVREYKSVSQPLRKIIDDVLTDSNCIDLTDSKEALNKVDYLLFQQLRLYQLFKTENNNYLLGTSDVHRFKENTLNIIRDNIIQDDTVGLCYEETDTWGIHWFLTVVVRPLRHLYLTYCNRNNNVEISASNLTFFPKPTTNFTVIDNAYSKLTENKV